MLVIRSHEKKKRHYNGYGFFDNLLSAITSKVVQDAAKEVVVNVGKKAATDLGNKASEKVINKIFPKEIPIQQSKLTPESRMLLNNILNRGSGIRRI